MGWKKWVGLLILDAFLFIPITPDLIILYLLLTTFAWVLKADLYLLYFSIRMPIYILIELPLRVLGFSIKSVGEFFASGLDLYLHRKKSALLVLAFSFLLANTLVPLNYVISAFSFS